MQIWWFEVNAICLEPVVCICNRVALFVCKYTETCIILRYPRVAKGVLFSGWEMALRIE